MQNLKYHSFFSVVFNIQQMEDLKYVQSTFPTNAIHVSFVM